MEHRTADVTQSEHQPTTPREKKLVLVIRDEPSPEQDLPALLRHYGHARVPATAESTRLAHRMMQRPVLVKRGDQIAGNTRQLDLPDNTEEDRQVLLDWHGLVRRTAARLGIDAAAMHIVDPKLLVASRTNSFDQAVHFDCERGYDAATKFSVLLFCSSGHMGTALPRFAANADLSFSSEPARMQEVAHLLQPENYESRAAMPGDIIFFAESTPHFGVANTCPRGDRVVLFSILSPSPESMQDAQQVFPWLFIGAAFGWESREYAQALVNHRAHRPITKLKDSNPAWAVAAVLTLQAHGLRDSYTVAI